MSEPIPQHTPEPLPEPARWARARPPGPHPGGADPGAGPRGVALTGADGLDPSTKACGATVRDGRVLLPVATADPAAQVARLLEVLGAALRL